MRRISYALAALIACGSLVAAQSVVRTATSPCDA